MNILVDTNVLVSAVIRDRLPQKVIEEIVSTKIVRPAEFARLFTIA